MAELYTIDSNQIKSYLSITTDKYDATVIPIVLSTWGPTIENMIDPIYLNDTSLSNIITTGKLLMLCGLAKENVAGADVGLSEGRSEVTVGKITVKQDNSRVRFSTSRSLYDMGWDLLTPYIKSEFLDKNFLEIISSNDNTSPEFTLTKYNEDGTIQELGSMDKW
jgi:hypothetical protein